MGKHLPGQSDTGASHAVSAARDSDVFHLLNPTCLLAADTAHTLIQAARSSPVNRGRNRIPGPGTK